MLWAKRAGCSGNRLWQWGLVALVVGLLFEGALYATNNPDGSVVIEPGSSIMPGSWYYTDVWGINEGIYCKAECRPCTGDHNCLFTATSGLTATQDHKARSCAYGSKNSTGTYGLAAQCPDDGSHGAPTTSFKVVDISSMSVDGVPQSNGATLYYAKAETGDVVISVALTPTCQENELRGNTLPPDDPNYKPPFMNWTNGVWGTDQLHRTVTKTVLGSTTVTCKAGNGTTGPTTWTVTIVVVEAVVTVNSELPGTSWDANIPLNATGGSGAYASHQAKVTVDTTPDNVPVTLDLGATTYANFDGAATTTITEGETKYLTGTEKGTYTITPKVNGVACGSPASGVVFRFYLVPTDTTFSGSTFGLGSRTGDDVSLDCGGTYNAKHAATALGRKYVSFATDPEGAYGLYVSSQLRVRQDFYPDHNVLFEDKWGAYVHKDAFTTEGDLSIALTYGVVTVGANMTVGEGGWSSWQGEVRMQGPNEAALVSSPQGQVDAKSSRLSWPDGGTDFYTVNTPDVFDSQPNHYKVGDTTSRAIVEVEHSCSGASAKGGIESKAGANLGIVVPCKPEVTIFGNITPTSQSAP